LRHWRREQAPSVRLGLGPAAESAHDDVGGGSEPPPYGWALVQPQNPPKKISVEEVNPFIRLILVPAARNSYWLSTRRNFDIRLQNIV